MLLSFQFIKRYWVNHHINYSLKVLFAFGTIIALCLLFKQSQAINTLLLGAIASALAEKEDNFWERCESLLLALIFFALATFSIELLFFQPYLFAAGLFLSTFGFTMLGALGGRYASISLASLLIAIYTMLNAEYSATLWQQPLQLLTGAAIYGAISLLWHLLWPKQAVHYRLQQLYMELSVYIEKISERYYPHQIVNYSAPAQKEDVALINALNETKLALLSRIRRAKRADEDLLFLHLYFIAQDIHEQISAIDNLAKNFRLSLFYSDVLFRIQYILYQQSQTCADIARGIMLQLPYKHREHNILALDELNSSIEYIKKQNKLSSVQLNQLEAIWQTIVAMERQYEHIDKLDNAQYGEDDLLHDNVQSSWANKYHQIVSQFTSKSLLFRHAVRLSSALTFSYILIQISGIPNGYWILLTVLLVCQPSYSAMRSRFIQRILGTLLGLVLGVPLIQLFSDYFEQLLLMLTSATLHFAFRAQSHLLSTTFITIFVMMSFSQHGEGFAIILPRLSDTLIGCTIAAFAVRFILPDWQAHRMRGIMRDAIDANRDYFTQVVNHYQLGSAISLQNYSATRRQAHNKDAQLTQAISNMLQEPGRYRTAVDEIFRFLYLNHTILGHISALAIKHEPLEKSQFDLYIAKAHHLLLTKFQTISAILSKEYQLVESHEAQPFEQQLLAINEEDDNVKVRNILQQFQLIAEILPEMEQLALVLAQKSLKSSKE
ncbi:MAG: YccS family putative transporter [Vibrionaceae bacterium]